MGDLKWITQKEFEAYLRVKVEIGSPLASL